MPSLSAHQSGSYVKLLYIGDSGTGKTGSLVSLLAEGYRFKVIDMDNGLDALKYYAMQQCPANLDLVEYETYRDKYTSTAAGPVCRVPKAMTQALTKMTEWSEIDDPNTIFVLDSGSAFGKAAFEWAKQMNPTAKDPRQWYFSAQKAVEDTIAMLTSEAFRMNVIVISHVNYREVTEGVYKGYANSIGSALGPVLARYFNTLVLAEASGAGKNVRRKIKTVPNGTIDLKISNPTIDVELPLESGLATIFKALKGAGNGQDTATSVSVNVAS